MTNELLEFEGGLLGLALNLDVREIGVVLLGDGSDIEEGQIVRRTGVCCQCPWATASSGRVVDPLGTLIDGPVTSSRETDRALELQAPTVVQRQPVKEPMQTGLKAVDAMTAIGRGQRQLIIGDRQTGKTALALDTILNQKSNWDPGIPRSRSSASMWRSVRRARPSPPCAAPSRSTAPGVHHDRGCPGLGLGRFQVPGPLHGLGHRPALDVQRPARPDRVRRPVEAGRGLPCRLAVAPPSAGSRGLPGDVFYLHSRLLERCAKLSDDLGGGSMTGLPIIETKANDVSAYIPTNVISITDGQCFLESDLFNSGVRPAINVGISVSRVGGSAQPKAMRKVAGKPAAEPCPVPELEAFAAFGSDLDKASKAQLERGSRLVELLKQPQYAPFSMEREVVSVWAGTSGQLDDVPLRTSSGSRLNSWRTSSANTPGSDHDPETGNCPTTP